MSKIKLIETRFVKGKIIESDQSKLPDGVLCRVQYPICEIGTKNHNGRIYEMEVWDRVYESEDVKGKLTRRNLFGNQEHPEDSKLRLNKDETSHIVSEIFTDGNTIKANMDILPTDAGKFIDVLLKAGCEVGVSTRAEGELEEVNDQSGEQYHRVVPESYKFITVDFTADPSTLTSYPEDIKRNVVGSVKDKYEAKTINKRVAMALLESVDTPESRKLEETIKKDGVSGKKKTYNVGTEVLREGKIGKVKHVFSRSNKYIVEFLDGGTVMEAEDILAIMEREDAQSIIGNESKCLNCSCDWSESRIIVSVDEMRYTTCVECGSMYKYNEKTLKEALTPKVAKLSEYVEIYKPVLHTPDAQEVYGDAINYVMTVDNAQFQEVYNIKSQIDRIADVEDKKELKKYFNSEYGATGTMRAGGAWEYFEDEDAEKNFNDKFNKSSEEGDTDGVSEDDTNADVTSDIADDFEVFLRKEGIKMPSADEFGKFTEKYNLDALKKSELGKELMSRLKETLKESRKTRKSKLQESQKAALLQKFKVAFPDAWVKPGGDFDGGPATLWSGEGAMIKKTIDGEEFETEMFNYYAEDPQEITYVMGIHKDVIDWADKNGLHWEAYDAGTYLAYDDNEKELSENKYVTAWGLLTAEKKREVDENESKVQIFDFDAVLKEMSNIEVIASLPEKHKLVMAESKTAVELVQNMVKVVRESISEMAIAKAERDSSQEVFETRLNELEENYMNDVKSYQIRINEATKNTNDNATKIVKLSESVTLYKTTEPSLVSKIDEQTVEISKLKESKEKEIKELKESHAKELKDKLTSIVNETIASTSKVVQSKIDEITTKFTSEISALNKSNDLKTRKLTLERKLQEAGLIGKLPKSALTLLEQAKDEEIDDLICEFRYAIKEGMFHHVTEQVNVHQEPEPENGTNKLLQQTADAVKFLSK